MQIILIYMQYLFFYQGGKQKKSPNFFELAV